MENKYIVFQYNNIDGKIVETFAGWASRIVEAKEIEDHCWEHGGDYISYVKVFEVKELW